MKLFNKKILNQKGMSLPMVIILSGIALTGVGYVTLSLIPKLQDEQKKASSVIDYRMFISSVNDYVVHGIRERWCINKVKMEGDILVSDLLISNDCGSGKPMEDVVTNPANLERILWDQTKTIGTDIPLCDEDHKPSVDQANNILAVNCLRTLKDKDDNPPLTTKKLTAADILPKDNKILINISEDVLQDMTDQHPLFVMAKNIKTCIKSVDIAIEKVRDIDNAPIGEEVKLGITVKANLYPLKLACRFLKEVSSKAFYTFYPRRLHNFSLLKYGDLDAGLNNDFHGPVYVAGDLVLPATNANAQLDKTTIFYDTLTLGTYNGKNGNTNVYRAGKIKNNDGSNYTFEDRGDPYKSKQDSYDSFRGILGGLRLDAVEDKGFYNLFDYTQASNANVNALELCIEQNKIETTPSLNKDSIIAYNSFTSDANSNSFKMSFSKKNRFKKYLKAPYILANPSDPTKNNPVEKYSFELEGVTNGMKYIGSFLIYLNNVGDRYGAAVSPGMKTTIKVNPDKFDVTKTKIDTFITAINSATKDNYGAVISQNHILNSLPERSTYESKGLALKNKCDGVKKSEHCTSFGYTANCDSTTDNSCDYSTEVTQYNNAKSGLVDRLDDIKDYLDLNEDAKVSFSLEELPLDSNGRKTVNQKIVRVNYTDKLKKLAPVLKVVPFTFEFYPTHFGPPNENLFFKAQFDMVIPSGHGNPNNSAFRTTSSVNNYVVELKLKNQDAEEEPYFVSMSSSTTHWRNLKNNALLSAVITPIEAIPELECPEGMGMADWDLDMSGSSNFSWNYANTLAGVIVDTNDHSSLDRIDFVKPEPTNLPIVEGYSQSTTKSVVNHCFVPKEREYIYGLYVCSLLEIEARTKPLYMIGTFIVKTLKYQNTSDKVIWHSFWDSFSADMLLADFHNPPGATENKCSNLNNLTLKDIVLDESKKSKLIQCSPEDLVSNGPNNFTWTTVDPDIGIAKPSDVMTSQKVLRILRWVVREDSRSDKVR